MEVVFLQKVSGFLANCIASDKNNAPGKSQVLFLDMLEKFNTIQARHTNITYDQHIVALRHLL